MSSLARVRMAFAMVVLFLPCSSRAGFITTITTPNTSDAIYDNQGGIKRAFASHTYRLDSQEAQECTFQTRYSSIGVIDVQGSTSSTLAGTTRYQVSFYVDNPGTWKLVINERLKGSFKIVNGGGPGRTYTTALTCTASPPLDVAGSLNIAGQASGEHSGDYYNTFDVAPNGAITGSGSRTVTLDFTWETWAFSDANAFGNGPEVALRLGESTDLTDVTADDYGSPAERDAEGHFITVTLLSDDPSSVVLDGPPMRCSPLSGAPCTYSAAGHVLGCVGNCYTVVLNYFSGSSFVCGTNLSVTNGNPSWTSALQCPGECTADRLEVSVINDPCMTTGDGSRKASPESAGPVVSARVVTTNACLDLPVPTTTAWGQIIFSLLLATAGTVVFGTVRVAAGPPGHANGMLAVATSPPFVKAIFFRALGWTGAIAMAGLLAARVMHGSVAVRDVIGTALCVPIAAYLVHTWQLLVQRDRRARRSDR